VLGLFQSILLVIVSVSVSLGFLVFLRFRWDPARRREHNDLIGWQVAVLGTTYAVIIGFMLYAVWSNYQAAMVNAQQESIALANVFHFAEGLPPESRDAVQKLSRDYAGIMLEKEWPAMSEGKLSPEAVATMQQFWATVMHIKAETPSETTALSLTVNELGTMNEHRRLRHLQSQSKLPGMLWAILIIGAIVTVASSCLFGTNNALLHAMLVFSLSLVISLSLAAIADIDQPYRGGVHIGPEGFEYALTTFNQLTPAAK
jgi:hypothetical protein